MYDVERPCDFGIVVVSGAGAGVGRDVRLIAVSAQSCGHRMRDVPLLQHPYKTLRHAARLFVAIDRRRSTGSRSRRGRVFSSPLA